MEGWIPTSMWTVKGQVTVKGHSYTDLITLHFACASAEVALAAAKVHGMVKVDSLERGKEGVYVDRG